MSEVDERKLKILAAVVDEYIMTGEPVGSKAVANHPDINVSSATIRNDMALLEQLGYLEQPHTSAGRIPTFNGYRLYIERVMSDCTLPDEEKKRLDDMFSDGAVLTEESIIESATTALAEITKCAAVVTNAAPKFSVISKVEVIPTGKRLYVILLITSNGSIKNKACRLEFDLNSEQLEFFSNYIQENLQGISVDSLSEDMLSNLITALGTYMVTLSPLIQSIYEMSKDLLNNEITVSGESNLLTCDELDKLEIVNFMEHKNDVCRILDESFNGIQVMFSNEADENNKFVIGNSSMIVSNYQKGDRPVGSLGIIGPMRLNYAKIIPYIEYFTQKITDLISDEDDNVFTRKDDSEDE